MEKPRKYPKRWPGLQCILDVVLMTKAAGKRLNEGLKHVQTRGWFDKPDWLTFEETRPCNAPRLRRCKKT